MWATKPNQLLCKFWGSKLRSPYLCSKHIIPRAISSARTSFIFMEQSVRYNWSKCIAHREQIFSGIYGWCSNKLLGAYSQGHRLSEQGGKCLGYFPWWRVKDCRGSGQSKELTTFCVSEWKLYFGLVFFPHERQEVMEVKMAFKLCSKGEAASPFLTISPANRFCDLCGLCISEPRYDTWKECLLNLLSNPSSFTWFLWKKKKTLFIHLWYFFCRSNKCSLYTR